MKKLIKRKKLKKMNFLKIPIFFFFNFPLYSSTFLGTKHITQQETQQSNSQNGTIALFTNIYIYIYQSTTISEICRDLPLFGYSSLGNSSFP